MNIEYINNNGYVVESDRATYVFDFVEGKLSGNYLRRDKPLLFIVSKNDPAYFSQSVLSYDKTSIFSDDFEFNPYRKVFMMGDNENIHFGFAQVFSFDSGNGGMSYLIKEKDVSIFYGGSMGIAQSSSVKPYDVLKRDFISAMSPIMKYAPVDVLIFGVDPSNQKDYEEAARYAIVGLGPKVFFPTRFNDYRDIDSFINWSKSMDKTVFYMPRYDNRKFEGVL